jgi:hypothetical protein
MSRTAHQLPTFDVGAMAVPENAVRFTIRGEAASKANSRELVTVGPKDNRRTLFRKSDKAIAFEAAALLQIPVEARRMYVGWVGVEMRMFYASLLPDLDESIVLDVMQARFAPAPKERKGNRVLLRAGVYLNDRQVWHKRVTRGHDPISPRIEIAVWPLLPELIA